MTNNQSELHFNVKVEDEWPPVSMEGILVTYSGANQFQIESPPLFVKGLSVGDVVDVVKNADDTVTGWNHISFSKNSTVWFLIMEDNSDIEKTLGKLEKDGAQVIRLQKYGCYSVNIPEIFSTQHLDEILSEIDDSKIAVAYPSFRHPE